MSLPTIAMVGNIPPPVGGAEVHNLMLSRRLVSLGHRVHIIRWFVEHKWTAEGKKMVFWHKPSERRSVFHSSGLFVHPVLAYSGYFFGVKRPSFSLAHSLANNRVSGRVNSLLLKRQSSVALSCGLNNAFHTGITVSSMLKALLYSDAGLVFSHNLYPNAFYSALCKKVLRIPLFVKPTGDDIRRLVSSPAVRRRVSFVLERSDVVFSMTDDFTGRCISLGADPSRIVPYRNGVDLDYFARARPRDPDVLLYAGRLVERKRVDLLLRAVARVAKLDPHVRLLVAGDSIERSSLMSLASKLGISGNVRFLLDVDHREMRTVYDSAGVFVLPSEWEGVSNSLLEAMSMRLPVVAADADGIRDVVTDGHDGLLFEPGNVSSLSGCLMSLRQDPAFAGRLAGNARKTVKERFDIVSVSGMVSRLAVEHADA